MARTSFAVTGAATDTQVIAAPGAGKVLKILRLEFTVSAAATVSFSDGNDAVGTRIIYGDFAANGGVIERAEGPPAARSYVAVLTPNTALKVTNSAGNVKGVVEYDVLGG